MAHGTIGGPVRRPARRLSAAALALLVLVALASACAEPRRTAAPGKTAEGGIRIAHSSWIGYGPLHVAERMGFFDKNGVDVQLVQIEDPAQRVNAMKAGQFEAVATSIDTYARVIARGVPAVQVWAVDASSGGDGILTDKSITSIAGLRGKKVAVSEGSTDEFFLAYLLSRNGMALKDVTRVNMTSDQAGAAFAAKRVEAAVTWEPWLTNAVEKNKDGHLLASTREYPTILADTIGFRPDVVKGNRAAVQGFVQAMADATAFIRSDPGKANQIMADAAKRPVKEIAGLLKNATLFDLAANKRYFGTAAAPGDLYKVFAEAGAFWKQSGQITEAPDPATSISAEFINGAR